MKTRIGYVNPHYPIIRNILEKCKDVEYVRCRSYNGLLDKIGKRFGLPMPNLGCSYIGGVSTGLKHVDLLHFWNSVCLPPCRKPFVVSFEDFVPRCMGEGRLFKMGLESVCGSRCCKLLAISDCAKDHQVKLFARERCEAAARKVEILHPPQQVLAAVDDVYRRRETNAGSLHFVFVGRDFFHKGGGEAVRALARVRQNYPIHLTVVGDPGRHDYVTDGSIDRTDEVMKFISANSDWITYHDSLPNGRVLQLIKSCDVGLLPTRDETYGYSVLEMQAAGVPCVTTDIWALPEINNDQCGWLVSVPKMPDRRAYFRGEGAVKVLSRQIEDGLVETLNNVCANPDEVAQKGVASLARIKAHHDPVEYGRRLNQIYVEALG